MTIALRAFITASVVTVLSTAVSNQGAAPGATVVPLAVQGRTNGTPWIAASGSFVAVAWGAGAAGRTDVFAAASRDGGRTFGAPVQVNAVPGEARLGGEMPPRVVVHRRAGAQAPEVTVLWTARGEITAIKAARSTDGGRTFQPAAALQAPGVQGDRGWPAMTADSRGGMHAIWLDHRGLAVARAAGGGRSTHQGGAHDGVAMAQKSSLYYAGADAKPSGEHEIAKGVCYCCKTALAAGPDGAIHAAWRHVFPGSYRDMAFSSSRDGGRTFSTPVRISEDRWELNGCPDDGPAMAVDSGGTVHVVWPNLIPGAEAEWALFYAASSDGRTFTPRARIPTLGGPKPGHAQIAVDRAGRVMVAWDETVGGKRVAVARQVLNGRGAPGFGDARTISGDAGGTYPVLAATDREFVAVWTAGTGEAATIQVSPIDVPARSR